MDTRGRSYTQAKTSTAASNSEEEVSSVEWEFVELSEAEEDITYKIYKLVGDRWHLIAGRIPGRKAEELERFWIMTHSETFSKKRNNLAYRRS